MMTGRRRSAEGNSRADSHEVDRMLSLRALPILVLGMMLPLAALPVPDAAATGRPHAAGKQPRGKAKAKRLAKPASRKPAQHAAKTGKPVGGRKPAGKAAQRSGQRRRGGRASRAIPALTRDGLPNLQARSALIVDLGSGQVLHSRKPDEVRAIASLSKLMAAMVLLERKLDLDGVTVITESDRQLARRGARSRLPVGRSFRNRDLLHAVLMASDNRAVPALGRAAGLSPERLAAAMTAKARSLGLAHTAFRDPVGLDPGNLSTAREVIAMLRAAIAVPLIQTILKTAEHEVAAVDRPAYRVHYNNTDILTRSGHWDVLGGKTGYTDDARYCLVVAVRFPGRGDIAVALLGAEGEMTRFADFSRTAQWLASAHAPKPATVAGTAAASPRPAGASQPATPKPTVASRTQPPGPAAVGQTAAARPAVASHTQAAARPAVAAVPGRPARN